MSFTICGVLALIATLQAANGLNCYTCNSNENVACSWGGLTSYTYDTLDCSSEGILGSLVSSQCFKITAESKDGREYVARGCIPSSVLPCSAIAKTVGWISSQSSNDGDSVSSINCYTCQSDKCNSAQKVTGATFIGLILAAAVFMF